MRRSFVLIAALLVLTACGDDEESIDPQADQALVDDALLTLDDLPDGFDEVTVDDPEDDDNVCNDEVLGINDDDIDELETAKAGPAQFGDESSSIRAEIRAFRETDLPERVLAAIGDEEYLDCLQDSISAELDQGEITGIDEIDSPVDGGRSVEVTFTLESGGGSVDVASQQHAVLVDRYGLTLQVTSLAGQIDDDLVEELLQTMIDRLEAG